MLYDQLLELGERIDQVKSKGLSTADINRLPTTKYVKKQKAKKNTNNPKLTDIQLQRSSSTSSSSVSPQKRKGEEEGESAVDLSLHQICHHHHVLLILSLLLNIPKVTLILHITQTIKQLQHRRTPKPRKRKSFGRQRKRRLSDQPNRFVRMTIVSHQQLHRHERPLHRLKEDKRK
jgi:hypothetical protein